jgi:dethiobiotin synthetase
MKQLFITGVGTGVGKTLVTTILCHQLRAARRDVMALKPVVSGFDDGDPASDPALILLSLGVEPSPANIRGISPWRFQAPLSPHEAARREGRRLTLDEIVTFCRDAPGGRDLHAIRLIEGAGGVMSPIAEDGTCLDLMSELGTPALLVTGTYLGAISHTLTALSALENHDIGLDCVVVSESAQGVGLAATVEALRHYGGGGLPLVALPRLAANPDPEGRWRSAPHLPSRILAEAEIRP